jgi:hypothetical protein
MQICVAPCSISQPSDRQSMSKDSAIPFVVRKSRKKCPLEVYQNVIGCWEENEFMEQSNFCLRVIGLIRDSINGYIFQVRTLYNLGAVYTCTNTHTIPRTISCPICMQAR